MSLVTWEDWKIADLRKRYPNVYCWYIYCYPRHVIWCARLEGGRIATINEPDVTVFEEEVKELSEEIAGQ